MLIYSVLTVNTLTSCSMQITATKYAKKATGLHQALVEVPKNAVSIPKSTPLSRYPTARNRPNTV